MQTTQSTTSQSNRLAYFALAAGILSLSFSAMFVRWADAPGPITGFYRIFLSTLILLPFHIKSGGFSKQHFNKNLIFPILAGVFTGMDFAAWNTAVFYTTAANATLLGNTAPLWVALIGWLVFKEKMKSSFWLGLSLALGGATLVLGSDLLLHPQLGYGDLLAILTGIFYAGYFIFTSIGRKTISSLNHMWLAGAAATATLSLINLYLGNPFLGYSTQTIIIFFAAAIVSQIIGYLSITYALGKLPASIVSPTMVGQPIVTALLAIPLLAEIPTPLQAIGGIIALTGIYLVNRSHAINPIKEPL